MQRESWRHVSVVSAALGASLLLSLTECATDHRVTSNSDPGQSPWPDAATGRYEKIYEQPVPAVPDVIWIRLRTDTIAICGEPFAPAADPWINGTIIATSRTLSDSLYEVITDFVITLPEDVVCTNRVTVSTRDTESLITDPSWRVMHCYTSLTCPQFRSLSVRYTLTRIGDFDCEDANGDSQ